MIFALLSGAFAALVIYTTGRDDESEKTRSVARGRDHFRGLYEAKVQELADLRATAPASGAHE